MVISKLDKKDKEVLTVIGTDNFSDGFREMRDSLLEIKQNKDKFLQLLEEVHFEKIYFILINFYWAITYPKINLLKFL